NTLTARGRHVEHDTRGAGAGRRGGLQILDVVVECGHVERHAPVHEAHLRADLVVPVLLVPPVFLVAEDLDVLGRAQRNVDRVIDSAQAEATRRLQVELRVPVPFVGPDRARGDAVRARRSRHAAGGRAGGESTFARSFWVSGVVAVRLTGRHPA